MEIAGGWPKSDDFYQCQKGVSRKSVGAIINQNTLTGDQQRIAANLMEISLTEFKIWR